MKHGSMVMVPRLSCIYHNRNSTECRKLSTCITEPTEYIRAGAEVICAFQPFLIFCAALLPLHSAAPHSEQSAVHCRCTTELKWCPLFSLITMFCTMVILHKIILYICIHGWWDVSILWCVIKVAGVRIWWMADSSFTMHLPTQPSLWDKF